jgi:beta-lactam-binding protein with PASTA domain
MPHRQMYWAVLLGLAACAARSPCPTFAVLQRITTKDEAPGSVVVKRADRIVPWTENMPLQRGDLVTTDDRTSVVLSFAGAQTLLRPDTSVTLGVYIASVDEPAAGAVDHKAPGATANYKAGACQLKAAERSGPQATSASKDGAVGPAGAQSASKPESSLFDWILALYGRITVDGRMRTSTKVVNATPKGTKYDVHVDKQTSKATVTVIEGHVAVSPAQAGAPSILLGTGRRVIVQQKSVSAVELVPSEELAVLAEEVEAMGRPLGPALPDVVGLELPTAETKLRALGIKPHVVPTTDLLAGAERAKRGQVLRQDPEPRVHAERVTLTVAAIKVPSVVGQTKAQAAASLIDSGLTLGRVEDPSHANDPSAVVVSQDPAAGADAATGTYLYLVLAPTKPEAVSGEAQPVQGTLDEVAVPDVTGATPAAALEALRNAGFRPWVDASQQRDIEQPRVTYQEPLPGHKLRQGAAVRIIIARPASGQGK